MKPYLVDVPVRVNIWIRPECQKRQFEIIKQARPSMLFLQSDGGRNEKEWEAIYSNRKLIEDGIDWECKIIKIYESENQGLYEMGQKVSQIIWSQVDRCIFLEDDQLPSVCYFRFCAELLEKYKDDKRVECICGMNQLGEYTECSSDYFFSRQGSIWGIAQWKNRYEDRNKYEYANDDYILKLLKQRTRNNKIAWNRLSAYAQQKNYEGHVAGAEFWIEFDMYAQNRVQIIPKVNMISNIGTTEDSAHAAELKLLPKGIQKVFHTKTYEIKFPLKHPEYVIPDVFYENKRNCVMGYNKPLINFGRKIERVYRILRYNGVKSLLDKMTKKQIIEK